MWIVMVIFLIGGRTFNVSAHCKKKHCFSCALKRPVYNIYSALLLQNVQNRRHNTINKIKENQSIALRKIKFKKKITIKMPVAWNIEQWSETHLKSRDSSSPKKNAAK